MTVRRIALGEINYKMALAIISKEVRIGIVNGLIVGVVVGVLTYFWFHQPMLSMVIGLAIIINLSMAGLIGSALPILFKHFKIDPAIASPLLLTTATDAMGFFIFLGLATLILL
ncbi:Magnesium transporter MgtE [compost metagenome]